MTNGQPLVVRAAKKPISTLAKPLESINLATKESEAAAYERSDICAVSAASVIVENVVAFEVARPSSRNSATTASPRCTAVTSCSSKWPGSNST
jgi:chorismate synthase